MHFSLVNKTVCPLVCAALLMSSNTPYYSCLLPQKYYFLISSSQKTILYPHFGQGTGTKRASNWYSITNENSKFQLQPSLFTTPTPPTRTIN
jgi:hypothetical protein